MPLWKQENVLWRTRSWLGLAGLKWKTSRVAWRRSWLVSGACVQLERPPANKQRLQRFEFIQLANAGHSFWLLQFSLVFGIWPCFPLIAPLFPCLILAVDQYTVHAIVWYKYVSIQFPPSFQWSPMVIICTPLSILLVASPGGPSTFSSVGQERVRLKGRRLAPR